MMRSTMEAAGVMAVVVMAALARVAADTHTNDLFVTAHNNVRKALGIQFPALERSDGLIAIAEKYVKEVGCTQSSNPSPLYGWNLCFMPPTWQGDTEAMNVWLGEQQFYHYNTNTCDENQICSHYLQIVWKTTKYVGCGFYICGNGDKFVACAYYPPGNIRGQRPY